MKKVVWGLISLLFAANAYGQSTVIPSSRFAWDQDGLDLPSISSYAYPVTIDGAPAGNLTSVSCAISPRVGSFDCSGSLPALTAGVHAASISAKNVAGESVKSNLISFDLIAIPAVPKNFRIIVTIGKVFNEIALEEVG